MKEQQNQRISRIPQSTAATFDQIGSSHGHLMDDYATPRDIEEPWKGAIQEEHLKVYSLQYHRRTLLAYHEWAKLFLKISIDKVYCITLQPFLKNTKSTVWGDVRKQ